MGLVVWAGCSNPPPPAVPDKDVIGDVDAVVDGPRSDDADAPPPVEEPGPDVPDAAPEAGPDAPPEAAVDAPPPSDAGVAVRGGIGSLGPRGWGRAATTILDDGFEYAGHRACAVAVCVTGGFVQ